MENKNIKKVIKNLYRVKMTDNEKLTMSNRLSSFIEPESIPSPYSRFTFHKSLTIALLIMIIVGSISQPVSASALPGEFLYPIKIIHEEIASVTKNTPEKKVSYEIERAEKRVGEANQLAKKSNLNEKKQVQIAESIKKHTEKVKEEIQVVKIRDPEKALKLNEQLEDSLKNSAESLKESVNLSKEINNDLINNDQENEKIEVEVEKLDVIIEQDIEEHLVGDDKEISVDTEVVFVTEEDITPEVKDNETQETDESSDTDSSQILLDIIEKDIKDAKTVSAEVQEEITQNKKNQIDLESQEEDEDHLKTLEDIINIENQIELINVEIEAYKEKNDEKIPQSKEALILRNGISQAVLKKDYVTALDSLEKLLEVKNLILDVYQNKNIENDDMFDFEQESKIESNIESKVESKVDIADQDSVELTETVDSVTEQEA